MPSSLKLQPEDEASVDRLVASGRYASREDVVHEAIRLVTARNEKWWAMAEAAVAEGRADAAAGRVHTVEEVFDSLIERYQTWPR